YAVEAASGEIVERRLTGDHAVLDDARIREVVATGASVAAHFATPQDIEFAVDRGGKLWLVQSRPITTLYPLPDGADPSRELRVFERLADDPRLAARGASRFATLRRIVPLALRLHVPQTILGALRSPDAARERLLGEVREMGRASVPDDAPPAARIDAFERLV